MKNTKQSVNVLLKLKNPSKNKRFNGQRFDVLNAISQHFNVLFGSFKYLFNFVAVRMETDFLKQEE